MTEQDQSETIRINKFIADSGYCSRREADKLIEQKKVKIDGIIAVHGDKVTDKNTVSIDGKTVKPRKTNIYIAFHKPFGAITTTDKNADNTVLDYIDIKERIYPVGRLDVESSGLLLLTNDGSIVNKLLKSKHKIEKEYLVTVDKPLTEESLKRLAGGLKIDNQKTLPAKVIQLSPNQFKIIIVQGLNRQIRRMCEALGYKVKILKRVKFAGIELKDLPRGKWRHLTAEEVHQLTK